MLPSLLIPETDGREIIAKGTQADSNMCWTCSSCDSECPVDIATGRLRPQRVVRLANLGLYDELLRQSEVWYCLTCSRCNEVCPNEVKPAQVVEWARGEALRREIVSTAAIYGYKDLFARFQRVRWHAVDLCLKGEFPFLSEDRWQRWLNTPISMPNHTIRAGSTAILNAIRRAGLHKARQNANLAACYTCSECSSACPLMLERTVFDPQAIIRMANLGMTHELLRSPAIWLCIACQRCTAACPQLVQGHQIIHDLRRIALAKGTVDRSFVFRLEKADKLIYARLIEEIDQLLGFRE